MRWLFLLLLVLNLFYYIWNQQRAPLHGVEIAPIEQYRAQEKNIRLLSESAESKSVASTEAASDKGSSVCMFFGGFEAQEDAEIFRQRLSGLNIQSEVLGVDAEPALDYWVYLPPLASREASLRQLKELQARQIDSFIIADGDLANGISLGIFPRPESAASVIGRLVEAGYEPILRELERTQRNFWVRVGASGSRLLDDNVLTVLLQDFDGLKHELKACSGVATDWKIE
ncbi:SPOR domain-containing protein [Pseudomonas sp. N040]|uniref:SPOR domain-containing protein n=1 Tax=Pseudomonas sp. N040 TaxID=2785325 RepID=UPI0018A262B1|nr:SPOR domain-containing protein [Pseudomonas sp. N040]MBW7015380.1 SPOR domain-containing protein [Pseudomonas sp. N040]